MLGLFIKNHAASLANTCILSVLHVYKAASSGIGIKLNHCRDENQHLIVQVRLLVPRSKWMRLVLLPLLTLLGYHRGFRLIRQLNGKPDLIHVHVLTRGGLVALWQKIRESTPYLISEHWSRYLPVNLQYKGLIRRKATRLVLRNASALICVSDTLRRAMNENGLLHKNTFIIPAAVDVNLFKPSNTRANRKYTSLLHVSCFDEKSKNICALIEAFKQALSHRPDLRLIMVGDGPDRHLCERSAADLNFSGEQISFLGLLTPQELAIELQKAGFLIQTSRYETFGIPVIESFASGVPVISTNVGVFAALCDADIGLVIPSSRPDDIARAILTAMDRATEFDRNRMRKIAVEQFSTEAVSRRLLSIYGAVINQQLKP